VHNERLAFSHLTSLLTQASRSGDAPFLAFDSQ
jgi:hypothetical protein